jgi:LPXTG-site transpeptidase (sortase) family protein
MNNKMRLRYRIEYVLDKLILDKRVGLAVAVLSPLFFMGSALYLSGYAKYVGIDNKFGEIVSFIAKSDKNQASRENTEDPQSGEVKSAFEEALKPIYTAPSRLFTDDGKIDVELIEVGVDDTGMLVSPKDWNKGGWFRSGSRPGETGNLIINAHYDNNYAQPAAFWELKNVKVDDKLTVLDKFGKSYTYVVSESFLVDINDPNRLQIFENAENNSTMTLITCGGVWLPGQSTYNKRLVVKGILLTD